MTISRKEQILENLINSAPFEGWNDKTLEKAAKEVTGDEKYAYIDFPEGISEAANYFIEINDGEMEKALSSMSITQLRIRDRIKAIVMVRLLQYEKHKEAVRKLVAFYALPQNAGKALTNISNTVSKMWYAAGDTSSDFNYYTKRMLLAGVYTSTLLYWLSDESDNYKETEKFLARRIENVMSIQQLKKKAREIFA